MPNTANQFDHPAWVLTGPTGSGKSEFALRLADAWNAEIIAMDSMTLYRGLDIGTAKPSQGDRTRVPHHLIDVLDPWESSSVAWWLGQATKLRKQIESRGRRVLFVGGTPLYLKALLHGMFEGPAAEPKLRAELQAEIERDGPDSFHRRLASIDPKAAARLHPNDSRRMIRAMEVWKLTGKPISAWQREWEQELAPSGIRCWWIERPRPELYARIDARVDRMIAAGWADEVRELTKLPQPMSREACRALGYAEMQEFVAGRASIDETRSRIQTLSRQYAKRQLTWFRGIRQCVAVRVSGDNWPDPERWPEFA